MEARLGFLAAALVSAISSAAVAQTTSGYYIGGGGGVNWNDYTGEGPPPPPPPSSPSGSGLTSSNLEFDTGWAALVQFGHKWENGFRGEIEASRRVNDLDDGGAGVVGGEFRQWAVMGNVLYDIALGLGGLQPYIGAGLGVARINIEGNGHDSVFAYQGIAGIAYNISQNLALWLDYRYFATQDPELNVPPIGRVEIDNANHTVLVGLRWFFDQPPLPSPATAPAAAPAPAPTPAPAAAPAAQRNFLVFFDWDKADITTEAQRIIEQAAASAKAGNVTRITATGHADRSGSDRYNQRLSERRGTNVKAALVRQGIAENQIVVVGKGETQPLVPTADGVREPQNRRVEIVLQ